MMIVKIMGGLGNQLFQYALYEKLKSLGKQVKLDTISFYENEKIRQNELGKFPDIELDLATEEEIRYYYDKSRKLHNRIIGKIWEDKKCIRTFEKLEYDERVYSLDDVYIQGFWQSEKYFSDIQDIMRKRLEFPKLIDEKNKQYYEQIVSCKNPVSIHIRRGDYLSEVNQRIYGNICTMQYYRRAIAYFERNYEDVTFFVFSNDAAWVKEHFKMKKSVIVDGNHEDKAIYDMFLMSRCKHNIIANSSFSWWGAWLNQNDNKEVIAPSKWLNTEKVKDIWCDGWVIIDG